MGRRHLSGAPAAKHCKFVVTLVNPPRPAFARRLSAGRARLRLSQSAAARLLAVNPRTFQNWEAGRNEPAPGVRASVLARLDGSGAGRHVERLTAARLHHD